MYQQITIKTLARQNEKRIKIAEQVGCHRNTVRNIINRDLVVEKGVRNKPSYFDSYRTQIKELIDKKVSHLRIYELLTEAHGIERTYDSLCKYIQKELPKIPEAFGVQITSPGEMAEVDFGYAGLLPANAPGEEIRLSKTWFLSVRLNYSRLAYREMTRDQKIITFIKGISNAFIQFSGVPKRLKIDNLRAAVIKNQHYDLQLNPDFLDFANYENVVINPCTPYHPEQKGGVESDVKYISNNFLVQRHFTDYVDLQHQFSEWSNNYANKRIHGITKKVPYDFFQKEEKQTLQPLPLNSYAMYERCERIVHRNCHVFFKNHYYSVPAKLITKTVTLRSDDSLLKVIHQGEEVACHLMSLKVGEYTTCRSHLPEYKCYGTTEYQQKYDVKMADIGEAAHTYFQTILIKNADHWVRSARVIMGLAHEYGNEAVNLSLTRALQYNVTSISVIKNIVTKRLYLQDVAPKLLITHELNVSSPDHAPAMSMPSVYLDRVLMTIKESVGDTSPSGSTDLSQPICIPVTTISGARDLQYYQNLLEE
jgi:transposase